jgi:hypothetical protein
MDIQVNLHVGLNICLNMPVSTHLQVHLHQTCRYLEESPYIYAYTHRYACKNEYLDEYVCITHIQVNTY